MQFAPQGVTDFTDDMLDYCGCKHRISIFIDDRMLEGYWRWRYWFTP